MAVVGTRDASLYGLRMAHNMGYGLTKCGRAGRLRPHRGIDETAARGALQAGGGCVGVLGTPIDAVRPYAGIAYDVSLAGALVSEYAPGTPFSSRFFRERNRITSGLAAATLVVRPRRRAGALLFVSEALEQGREVFAVPGNADSARSEGSNRLIMEGAQPRAHGLGYPLRLRLAFPEHQRGREAEAPARGAGGGRGRGRGRVRRGGREARPRQGRESPRKKGRPSPPGARRRRPPAAFLQKKTLTSPRLRNILT